MTFPLAGELAAHLPLKDEKQPSDRWFERLAHAKHKRIEAWVDYLPLHRAETSRWRIRPFSFTVNSLSDGMYVLCEGTRDEEHYLPLSLKFDRIVDVRLTNARFEIIDKARFSAYEGRAWGVWSSDRESTQVMLRFEPRHYDRLLESVWHPSQGIRVDTDGYVFFTVAVSEPDEMIPWIRSWGSGVVVLEPDGLRQRIIRSLRRQMQNYGIEALQHTDDPQLVYAFWAKYDRKTGIYHPLIYHMLDVAAVAWLMWERVLSAGQRDWVSGLLHIDSDGAGRLLAFLAGLHDIGKATPGFQKKAPSRYEVLVELGFDAPAFDQPHGLFSTVILKEWFKQHGIQVGFAGRLASAIGGHHGAWISFTSLNTAEGMIGTTKWKEQQANLCDVLQNVLGVDALSVPDGIERRNHFAVFLSGFISACDWIGSDETYFFYEMMSLDLSEYLQRAVDQAETALAELGWFGWQLDGQASPFDAMFRFSPNPFQQSAIDAIHFGDHPPKLVLVEYATGGGKTELALYLADQFINRYQLAGTYVAMPTQATSNQMFERVGDYLKKRYPHQAINLQLIHAQADSNPFYRQIQPQPEREGNESGLTAEQWFQNRKRALLAPYAVGTIDQAMLSVLQAKHHFVRQFALSHKVVIFDEIHGYDTYMNAIIDCLFQWLDALQAPMILLSATLAQATRQQLLQQVTVNAGANSNSEIPYPRLTVVDHDGRVTVHPLPRPADRIVHLHYLLMEVAEFGVWLAPIYQAGGCIAVLCNTVDEAIAVARALRNTHGIDPENVLLFHARYPMAWRDDIEQNVLNLFSKNGERPTQNILVSTQIIEQSLDLDFDLMVTSTAPIDLLIQRAGRLHRHERSSRPSHLNEPTLVIRTPMINEQGVPNFGVDEAIYARYILLKTWLILRDASALNLPDDIDPMMNFVYSEDIPDDDPVYQAALTEAFEQMTMNETRSNFKGTQVIIGKPDDEQLIGDFTRELSDDERLNIATRDIRPGVDIICITDALRDIPLDRKPSRDLVNALLRYRVTVRGDKLRKAIETALPTNPAWERVPQLRYACIIRFDGKDFPITDSPYSLRLTPDYGLEIIEKESQ